MTDNEFILFDRLQKIKSTVEKYGEENFYISYSGGKDSNVLSALFDMALPDNKIPRVYCDTGIEQNAVRDFVREKAAHDDRFIIIQPKVPIKKMLETVGYPFKSKYHSRNVYQNANHNYNVLDKGNLSVTKYLGIIKEEKCKEERLCPKRLRYQFEKPIAFKISDKCCDELKKKPFKEYEKQTKRYYPIIGLLASEGGAESKHKMYCRSKGNNTFSSFSTYYKGF